MSEEHIRAEHEYIEMEAARIDSSERYFNARPQIDDADRRKVFESGFDRGWQAALSAKSVPVTPDWLWSDEEFTFQFQDATSYADDAGFEDGEEFELNGAVPVGLVKLKIIDRKPVVVSIQHPVYASPPLPTDDERVRELEKEVYIDIINGLYLKWGIKGTGFGELSIYKGEDGKLYCSNEAMGRAWVKGLLSELVDMCEFDCPHSLETKEPIKPRKAIASMSGEQG